MGEVYLAEDTSLHRQVAIKFLSPEKVGDAAAARRLVREARAAARLDHPNICAIYEVRNNDDGNYIVMQYIEGESLDSILKTKRLAVPELLSIAVQLAEALAEAHDSTVIHRDIKPKNIMINSRNQVKMLDFGLAKIDGQARTQLAYAETQSVLTSPDLIMGTPHYMSPEHMEPEELDSRCDIFSFGIVLYEMIAGQHPFLRTTAAATLRSILTQQPPSLSAYRKDVPPELERIVRKCLEKDKHKRYQRARALLEDLQALKRRVDKGRRLFEKLRTTTVRNVILVGAALAVCAGGFLFLRSRAMRTTTPEISLAQPLVIDSVAVLPLSCQDADVEYLCSGITESITNKLSSVSRLKVIARTTSLRYKGRETDALAVGQELGVKSVMTGRLTKQGDELKIQIDLINISNGSQILGQQYTQKLSNMLFLEDDISAQIAQGLRLKLTGSEMNRLKKHDTDSTEAHMLYVRGRFFWNKRSVEDLRKAAENFEAAIKLDPEYALAYTGLADSYMIQTRYGVAAPKVLLTRAKEAAQKAIAIDEDLAEAHTSLAAIKADIDWDWPAIEREHRRAIELNPNYPTAHNFYSWYLMAMGRPEEAKREMSLALELDPGSLSITASMGLPYFYSGDIDKAIEYFRKCLDMDSNFILAHWYLGMAYEQKGMYDEAIAEWNRIKLIDTSPELITNLGYSYALSGRRAEAFECLATLEKLSKDRYVSPFQIGIVYLGLGDTNQAFSNFERAFDDRSLPFTLNVDPRFVGLRNDSRFIKLLRYLNLAV